jgi:hypothetical protein
MAEPVAFLTMGEDDPPLLRHPAASGRVRALDCYDLDETTLGQARALLVGMHVDQRYLAGIRHTLDTFVGAGGRLVVCGQVAVPFLAGLSRFCPLVDYALEDLEVHSVRAHPVWAGVEPEDLTLRRGVAGFYGRGWHQPPSGAVVVNGLGPRRLPLDFFYPIGAGEVLVHGGNDLWSWGGEGDSSARLVPQLLDWVAP